MTSVTALPYSFLGGRVGDIPETRTLFAMVFIHIWNTKASLRMWSKRLWWMILVRNKLLTVLWSFATEVVVRQWKNLVVNTVLLRKPVKFFSRQACCVLSSLSVSQFLLLCSAQVEDGAVSDLASPTNRCCSNPALIRQCNCNWNSCFLN